MREFEKKSEIEPAEKEINYKSAVEIIMDSPHAGYYIGEVSQIRRPMEDRLLEALGGILQSGHIRVIDDDTDEEIPTGVSYGKQYLSMGSRSVPFYEPGLKPEFVISFLEVKSVFPDVVINYRLGHGHSIELPNPDYDPSRGKKEGGNPRFLQIPIAKPPERGKS